MVRRVVLPVALFALLLPGSALAQQYHRTDLTADSSAASATAPNLDTNLVNACGVCLAGLAVLGHLTLVHNRIIAHGQHVIVYRDRAAIASKSECLVRHRVRLRLWTKREREPVRPRPEVKPGVRDRPKAAQGGRREPQMRKSP